MLVKIEINIHQFEVIKMSTIIIKIHIKMVKNTIVMHKNNKKMGSAIVRVGMF